MIVDGFDWVRIFEENDFRFETLEKLDTRMSFCVKKDIIVELRGIGNELRVRPIYSVTRLKIVLGVYINLDRRGPVQLWAAFSLRTNPLSRPAYGAYGHKSNRR